MIWDSLLLVGAFVSGVVLWELFRDEVLGAIVKAFNFVARFFKKVQ